MVTSRLTTSRLAARRQNSALRAPSCSNARCLSNFGCWQIEPPAAHKPTNTIFFIIPSNVL
jgi:hypothetical protein